MWVNLDYVTYSHTKQQAINLESVCKLYLVRQMDGQTDTLMDINKYANKYERLMRKKTKTKYFVSRPCVVVALT
jgi:hypothetical protein